MTNCRLPIADCRFASDHANGGAVDAGFKSEIENRKSKIIVVVITMALLGLVAGVAQAKVAVVWLQDRVDPLRGELISETADTVTLSIAGIATTLDKNRILRIAFELTLEEEYQQKKAGIASDDFNERYELARWLYDQGSAPADEMAVRELTALLNDDQGNERAKLLLGLVQQRIATRQEAELQSEPSGPTTPPPPPPSPARQEQDYPLLTEQQCNLLKVYEVDPGTRPRLEIPNETLDEFLDQYRADLELADYQERAGRARFKQLKGYEQLQIMFKAKARDFYDKVTIRDEPQPLQFFRTKINPLYVAGYFIRTFGPEPAPGVKLTASNPQSEAPAYTNYLMLHRSRVDGLPFIDRDRPEESLLLQWGLPRLSAKHPAPETDGWKQFFTGTDDPRFTMYVDWVKTLDPTMTYPIDYSPTPVPAQPPPAAKPVEGQPRPATKPSS